jgi:hypothetical protein
MISFSQGSGYAPAGKPIIMNVSNNLGYTTDENGLLRNAGDVMMDAASRAVITNTPYNYIVLENNNTYYY